MDPLTGVGRYARHLLDALLKVETWHRYLMFVGDFVYDPNRSLSLEPSPRVRWLFPGASRSSPARRWITAWTRRLSPPRRSHTFPIMPCILVRNGPVM